MISHLPNAWTTFYHPFKRFTSDCPNSFSKYTRGHIAESKIPSSFCHNASQMQRIEWRNFRNVLDSHKKHKRTKLIKMIHNHWPQTTVSMNGTDLPPINTPYVKNTLKPGTTFFNVRKHQYLPYVNHLSTE